MSYGTLALRGDRWWLQAQPHIIIRVKRIFPRARWGAAGSVTLSDTLDVARDLEWILERWPLDMADDHAAYLVERAKHHRQREEKVVAILGGYAAQLGFKEPGRPPRPYQQTAADLVHTTGRLLIADDVGLGKSMTSLLVLMDPDALPALVVTLTHLPPQWVEQLRLAAPWLTGHIAKTGRPYDLTKKTGREPDVIIMNYAKVAGWSDHLAARVNTVIFDEVQELRRDDSDKYRGALNVAAAARYRVGLSATPVYNYGGEMHNIMEVLAPGELGSRDEFVREWGGGMAGLAGNITVRDPAALGTYLRDQSLMLRRTRKDVHMELPEPVIIPQRIDTDSELLDKLTGDVADIARLVLAEDTSNTDRWQASGDLDWRMRHATGLAKAPYVAEFVRLLLESEDKVVLFGWHRDVYDVWMARLAEFRPVMYTGSESPVQKRAAEQAFTEGDARVLIMSLRSGAGLDGLQEVCSVVVFGELDWSPGIHTQCVGRLNRDGQDATVAAFYLLSEGGTDPLMEDVLDLKRQQADPITDPDRPLLQPISPTIDRVRLLAQAVLDR